MPSPYSTLCELCCNVHSSNSLYFVKVYKCVIYVTPGTLKKYPNLIKVCFLYNGAQLKIKNRNAKRSRPYYFLGLHSFSLNFSLLRCASTYKLFALCYLYMYIQSDHIKSKFKCTVQDIHKKNTVILLNDNILRCDWIWYIVFRHNPKS